MKSNIIQAFFRKTGKKTEINVQNAQKILEILFIIEEMHIERRKNGKEC